MKLGPELGIRTGERWRRALAAAYLAQDLGLNTPYVQLVEVRSPTGPSGLSNLQQRLVGMVGSLQEWRQGYEGRPAIPKPSRAGRILPGNFGNLSRPQLEAIAARLGGGTDE